jgi:hypothetical protein
VVSGIEMNTRATFVVILSLTITSNTSAISKTYTGRPIPVNRIVDGMQFIEKGKTYLDLDQAPMVVYFDKEEQSIKFTIGGSQHPDSVITYLIPGDRISIRISVSVSWHDEEQLYQYIYEVQSLGESKVPIDMFSIHTGFETNRILTADGWIIHQSAGYNSWSPFQVPRLMPGESLRGLGYKSSCPPSPGIMTVRGEPNIFKESLDEWEPPPKIVSFLTDYQVVECLILIPAPKTEKNQSGFMA